MLVAEDAQKMLWLSVMVTPEGALHSALFGLCDREKHGRHLSTKTTCSDSILYRLFCTNEFLQHHFILLAHVLLTAQGFACTRACIGLSGRIVNWRHSTPADCA